MSKSKYIDAEKLKAEIERLKRSVELNREHYNNIPLESRNDLDAYYAQELILNSLIDTITSLQQEQPNNNEKEKAISLQIQAYLTTASDELYAPGKPLYTEAHHKGIHECMLMWQKLHQYYFSTKQEQQEVSSNLIDADAVRDDFMTEVYRILDADSTNDRANQIIRVFDSLPTVEQQEQSEKMYNKYVPQSLDAVEYIKNDPTKQLEVDLEKEYKTWWNSITGKINVEHIMEWYMHETARHFFELGLKAK